MTRQHLIDGSSSSGTSSVSSGTGLGLLHAHAGRAATVAPRIWAGVTVQVAWTLLSSSVRVRADTLRDARDHVLLMLPPDTTPANAADRAVALTREFVRIARRSVPEQPSPDTDRPLSAQWRRTLMSHRSEYEDLVLREHFENTRSLAQISKTTGVPLAELEGARLRVREVLRTALIADRVTAQAWPAERLDALIERLVTMTWGTCPSMQRVLRGAEREHVRRCSVCGRARRLVNAGTLTPADLILDHPVPWPRTEGEVLAVHLHPDARRDRDLLAAELGVPAFPIGDDLLFVDLDDPDEVHRVLLLAAEAALPRREHLRAVVVRGPLRWSGHGLLGPLVRLGASRVRGASWGLVGGLGELPAPLPPPPSARPVWAVAALLAVLTALVATQRIVPASASTPDIVAEFTVARGGVWAEFDADDRSLVHIVRQVDDDLDVVLASTDIADKVTLAVGDGSYRAHVMGDGVMLVATDEPIDDLPVIVAASTGRQDALAELERRLVARLPTATIARTPTASP